MNNLLTAQIIVFIVFTLVYYTLDAFHDSCLLKWRSTNDPDQVKKYSGCWHKTDALIKGLVGALAVWLIFGITWLAANWLALFLTIRWIWFDSALNLFNGLPLTYVGKTAFLDRIFKRPGTQFAFKFVILSLVVVSLFFTDQITHFLNGLF